MTCEPSSAFFLGYPCHCRIMVSISSFHMRARWRSVHTLPTMLAWLIHNYCIFCIPTYQFGQTVACAWAFLRPWFSALVQKSSRGVTKRQAGWGVEDRVIGGGRCKVKLCLDCTQIRQVRADQPSSFGWQRYIHDVDVSNWIPLMSLLTTLSTRGKLVACTPGYLWDPILALALCLGAASNTLSRKLST